LVAKNDVNEKTNIFKNNKAQASYENKKLTILPGSILPRIENKMNELIKKNNVGHNEQIKIFSDMLVQFST
jgi:hypothetical protein